MTGGLIVVLFIMPRLQYTVERNKVITYIYSRFAVSARNRLVSTCDHIVKWRHSFGRITGMSTTSSSINKNSG